MSLDAFDRGFGRADPTRSDVILLTAAYLLAHGGILFIPNALFWDDWLFAGLSPELVVGILTQVGASAFSGTIFNFILANGLYLSKALTFLSFGAANVALYLALRNSTYCERSWAITICLLFSLAPLNTARISLVTLIYSLSFACFFLGWCLLYKNRVAAFLLFALSFSTPSNLVFYLLPIAAWMVSERHIIATQQHPRIFLRYAPFLILPIAFWWIKRSIWVPHGAYAGYNQNFYWDGLLIRFSRSFDDFLPYEIHWIYLLFLLPAVWLLLRRMQLDLRRKLVLPFAALGIGAVALILAMFPYLIVGHIPTFWEWTSRHQLLMPLGGALLLAGVVGLLPNAVRLATLCFIVSVCISANLAHYVSVWKDANKQEKILEAMKKLPNPTGTTLYLFDDKTPNALRRHYRQYEWTGMLKRVHGDETRFGIGIQEAPNYAKGEYDKLFVAQYLASAHRRTSTAALLVEVRKVRPANCRAFCAANYELHAKLVQNEVKP